jgi:hypothetical protein
MMSKILSRTSLTGTRREIIRNFSFFKLKYKQRELRKTKLYNVSFIRRHFNFRIVSPLKSLRHHPNCLKFSPSNRVLYLLASRSPKRPIWRKKKMDKIWIHLQIAKEHHLWRFHNKFILVRESKELDSSPLSIFKASTRAFSLKFYLLLKFRNTKVLPIA